MERREWQFVDGKGLNSRLGGKKPAKSPLFAPKLRPKINQPDLWGDQPFF
jgi:hypothetical protein